MFPLAADLYLDFEVSIQLKLRRRAVDGDFLMWRGVASIWVQQRNGYDHETV